MWLNWSMQIGIEIHRHIQNNQSYGFTRCAVACWFYFVYDDMEFIVANLYCPLNFHYAI